MNTYLKVALLCVSVVAVGLVVLTLRTQRTAAHTKPLVIRIDEVGRAQAVQYEALTYRPVGQAPELKYFLVQFVTKHFSRVRTTVKKDYSESLYFLDGTLADATIARDQREQTVEKFLTSAADEVEVQVTNVTLQDLSARPFRAAVDFEKTYYTPGTRQAVRHETNVAQIAFLLRDQVPNDLIPVNPLGLTITSVRVDQAFK
jgi:type IV secretion system protein VirB5